MRLPHYVLLFCFHQVLVPIALAIDSNSVPERRRRTLFFQPRSSPLLDSLAGVTRRNNSIAQQHLVNKHHYDADGDVINNIQNNNASMETALLSLHCRRRQQLLLTALRGGGTSDAGIMEGERKLLDAITLAKVLAYASAGLLAVLTVGLVRKIPRSGGRGPRWLTNILPEPFATAALHVGYLLHCIAVLKLLPVGVRDVVFSSTGVVLLGTLFPVAESIRAAASSTSSANNKANNIYDDDPRIWLQYWIVHGLFSYGTEFIDKLADKIPFWHRHWNALQFYLYLWLLLPMTDGATVAYELVTKPYLVPLFRPVNQLCEGWLTTIALTMVNASYMWWFSVVFLALPNVIKRLAVMFTGTVFPIIATVMAVATMNHDIVDGVGSGGGVGGGDGDMKWLTYWSCFSLLHLAMTTIEKLVRVLYGPTHEALSGVPGMKRVRAQLTLFWSCLLNDIIVVIFILLLLPQLHNSAWSL
jgi:hypothetical protein